jgi:hypothetical protein
MNFLQPVSDGFLIGLLLYPEAGSDMFLRNVRQSSTYKALQPRRPHYSLSQPWKPQTQQNLFFSVAFNKRSNILLRISCVRRVTL